MPPCKHKRNKRVEQWCEEIFGALYYQMFELENIRRFQENLLSIQVITEVSGNGDAVPDGTGGVKLVRACNIRHEKPQARPFDPTSVEFSPLPSVQNINNWNEAMILNLLHFFRNFTTHRSVIECKEMRGHLNLETMEYVPELDPAQIHSTTWITIKEGCWIKLPELRHLRQEDRTDPITFYNLPVVSVCSKFLGFVKGQRDRLLAIVGGLEGSNVNDEISCDWHDGAPRVKINGQLKEWYNARYDTSV